MRDLYCVFLVFLSPLNCLENLSKRNTTVFSQSSTNYNLNADLAKDGIRLSSEKYCAQTKTNQTKAWFQVDLGKIFYIDKITVYYRNEVNWRPYRLRQFYVDVSDSPATQTTTAERIRCHTDMTIYPDIIPYAFMFNCVLAGRYVIFETTYDAPEDNPIRGAILEICCEEGHCGSECLPCQKCGNVTRCGSCSNCINKTCFIPYGTCWYGCFPGSWFWRCSHHCPVNCLQKNCMRDIGHCYDCKHGYWGDKCDRKCPVHCRKGICDREHGNCVQGCDGGRFGDTCEDTCSRGCVDQMCEQESGYCTVRCVENLVGVRCDRCDLKNYGFDCSFNCSEYCEDGCSRDSGTCYNCIEGNYGDTCDKKCGAGCVSGCHRYNGSCECKSGWQGDNCDGCNSLYHGLNCETKCSPNCVNGTCFAQNGSCVYGCNCSIIEELRSQVELQQKSVDSCNQTVLYVISGILSLSGALNVLLIVRNLRSVFQRPKQSTMQEVVGPPIRHPEINDAVQYPVIQESSEKVEEDAGYQELGGLARPSLYDQLERH